MNNIQRIASRMKIVSLNMSAWSAVKQHKKATEDVNKQNNTDAAKVSVRLTEHKSLKEIYALRAAVYQKHVKLTLPSIQDGVRLVPCGKEFEHMEMVRAAKQEYDRLAAEFISDYDKIRSDAPQKLGSLYDSRMWPSSGQMKEKFGINCRYLNCPTDGAWAEWIEESGRAAVTELKDQLEEGVKRVAERCGELDGRLFSSVFTNLQDLISSINEIDSADSEIARLADSVKALANYDAAALRNSPTERLRVAEQAHSLLSVFEEGSL